MIKRKAQHSLGVEAKVGRAMANLFDHGDGSYAQAKAAIKANLLSLSTTVKPAKTTAKPSAKKAAQTKRPSQKKAESEKKAENKKKPNKVKPKAPAKPKAGSGNKAQPRPKKPGGGGGGGGQKPKAAIKKESIVSRWAKMSDSAKSAYLQSKAGKSVRTPDADTALAGIWGRLTLSQQQAHKRRHPQSRLKVTKKKDGNKSGTRKGEPQESQRQLAPHEQAEHADVAEREEQDAEPPEPGSAESGPHDDKGREWWDAQDAETQQKYLAQYPKSKFALQHRGIVRNLVAKASDKIKESAKRTGSDYHHGMEGIKAFRKGAKMTERQKEGLKRTAAKVAAVVALALVGVAVLSPLGPVAMDLGQAWYQERKNEGWFDSEGGDNKAEAGVNLEGHEAVDAHTKKQHESDSKNLAWMVRDMTRFVLAQKDPKAFAKRLQAKAKGK